MITYDLETHLITVDDPHPAPVCSTAKRPGEEAWIFAGDALREHGRAMLLGDEVISSHSAYDFWVLGKHLGMVDVVLERFAAGLIFDTQIDELLVRIRSGKGTQGGAGVGSLIRQYEGIDLRSVKGAVFKEDGTVDKSRKDGTVWRLNYALLAGVPLRPGVWQATRAAAMRDAPPTSALFRVEGEGDDAKLVARGVVDRYPREAIDYALSDVEHQERIHEHQVAWWEQLVDRDRRRGEGRFRVRGEEDGILDSRSQAAYAFALADMETVGAWTDGDLAREIRAELLRLVDEIRPRLAAAGFLAPKTGRVWTARMLERERRGQTRITAEDPFRHWKGEWSSKDNRIREAVSAVLGDEAPRTEKGSVKKDRATVELAVDALEERLADEPEDGAAYQRRLLTGLKSLAGYNGAKYQVEHYLEPMIAAADLGRSMRFRINCLVNSGRTSSSSTSATWYQEGMAVSSKEGTNMQNVTREASFATLGERCGIAEPWPWAKKYSVRRVVVPPPADDEGEWAIVDLDYKGVENVTIAETLDAFLNRGKRRAVWEPCSLTRLINANVDLHSALAAKRYGFADWREFYYRAKGMRGHAKDGLFKQRRDSAKPVNFGRPGGMAAPKFRKWLRSQYGWRWSLEEIETWFDAHLEMVPEMPEWKRILRWQHENGFPAVQLYSRRVRGGCTLNSRANTYFQGLAIDGFKRSIFMQCCAVRLGRYPVLTLPERRAPTLFELRERMAAAPSTYSGRFTIDPETEAPVACEQRWRMPTRVTRRWGKVTYWVEDDRMVGTKPFLVVHDSDMVYARRDRTADVTACMDEIMCRGLQAVVPGKLVQTEGEVFAERWS